MCRADAPRPFGAGPSREASALPGLKRRTIAAAVLGLLPLIASAWVSAPIVTSNAVYPSNETGTPRNGRDITAHLGEVLGPHDHVYELALRPGRRDS